MAALRGLFPENSLKPWIAIKPGSESGSSDMSVVTEASKEPDPSVVFDTFDDVDEHDGTGRCVVVSPGFSETALTLATHISGLYIAVHSPFHGNFGLVSGALYFIFYFYYSLLGLITAIILVYRAPKQNKFRLSCGHKRHNSPNFLGTVMGDASVSSTCDCVSRVKEWLCTSMGCFDCTVADDDDALPTDDVAVAVEGGASFVNGQLIYMFYSA